MSILDTIVTQKRKEVADVKREVPLKLLLQGNLPEVRDFKSCLLTKGVSIIAEMKRKSPSAGLIRKTFDPIAISMAYEKSGADALSVLTDEVFFGGNKSSIPTVKEVVQLPVLRKEFIIDEYQIVESRYIGADAILLIAKILRDEELKNFIQIADDVGLVCLVEVHTSEELERALKADAEIIGINNRDLDTFDVDLGTSLVLVSSIPKPIIKVSESGIRSPLDIQTLWNVGFDAVLIGETLMRAERVGEQLSILKSGDRLEGSNPCKPMFRN